MNHTELTVDSFSYLNLQPFTKKTVILQVTGRPYNVTVQHKTYWQIKR